MGSAPSTEPRSCWPGKTAIGTALLGALLAGGGPVLVGFFTTVGAHIITSNVDRSNGPFTPAQITVDVQIFCGCADRAAQLGEPVQIQYRVSNAGQRSVAAVRVTGSDTATCALPQLGVNQSELCTATHLITAADLGAGHYTASGTATATADDGTVLAVSASSESIRTQP